MNNIIVESTILARNYLNLVKNKLEKKGWKAVNHE